MIKGNRTKLIEKIYSNEIDHMEYEIYQGSDTTPHIRTFAVLNDGFGTRIKVEELGRKSSELLDELKANGYINNSPTLSLKK